MQQNADILYVTSSVSYKKGKNQTTISETPYMSLIKITEAREK
jgi:hypothetical protein